MASRASFDANRSSSSRGAVPGRASTDHHHVKTLEMDTARPFSYATPRRHSHGGPSPTRHHSPVTPSPGKARPPVQVRSSASPCNSGGGGSYTPSLLQRAAVPNYMAATESARARARSKSAPRQRPATPDRDRLGAGAKKRLSYPAAPPVSASVVEYARSPSFKSAAGRFSSEQRSTVSSSCADSLVGADPVSPSSTTDLRRWLR
jgi:hypothetical protein